MAQIHLVFYNDLWPLFWKSSHHHHCSYTKIIWHTSGKSSFFCSGKKNSHYYQACCYTTCQEENFFQNLKQSYHCRTYLALKVRRTTRRPLIIFVFSDLSVWIFRPCQSIYLVSVQTISTNLEISSAAMFHVTIELTSSHMLFDYKALGMLSNLAKSP